jgi:cytochrome b
LLAAEHVRVWDPLVRTIHWSVATLIVIELFNEAGANPWHRYLGYLVAALVVVRLAWGCGDRGYASLAVMSASASQVLSYLRRAGARSPGHTPPGALMAFTLWALVLLVAVTGWMLGLDQFWGEDWLQQVHEVLAYVLAGCAVIHIAAAFATSHAQRVNLVKAMITGDKPARLVSNSEER